MSTQTQTKPAAGQRRISPWILLGIQIPFLAALIWTIATFLEGAERCDNITTLGDLEACVGRGTGVPVGVIIVVALWILVDVGIAYAIYRFGKRG